MTEFRCEKDVAPSARRRRVLRELFGFGVAGGVALVVDLMVFNLLIFFAVNASLANVSAALAALVVNFFINHRAFMPRRLRSANLTMKSVKFGILALASFLFLLVGFEVVLWVMPDQSAVFYSVTRILLIGSGTLIRFFVLKYWVFSHQEDSERV